ncbi:MAG: LemA family protein [Patescibacteria group bacterium]
MQYIISSCPFRGFLIQIMYRRSFNSSFFNMEAFIVILAIVILVGLYALFLYNSLVSRRNRVDEGWSDIDVQLKRRHDLIPNLVESVKGYASHEQETLTKVIEARNVAMAAQASGDKKALAGAENMLSDTLKSIFALSENYPALRANENFLHLQQELTDTENKIQASRRFYNGQVRDYSIAIQKFPAMMFAKALGFGEREFFEADEAERETPQVKF